MIKTAAVRPPPLHFLNTAAYTAKFGDINTNGMREKGHREHRCNGEDGYAWPSTDVTVIETNDIAQSELEECPQYVILIDS